MKFSQIQLKKKAKYMSKKLYPSDFENELEYVEADLDFKLDKSNYILNNKGKWYADTAEGIKLLDEGGGIGILPILEMNRTGFDSYLNNKVKQSDSRISELTNKIM